MFAMTVYMMAQNAVGIKEIRHCDSVVADLTIAEQPTIHTILHPSTQLILDLLSVDLSTCCIPSSALDTGTRIT